MPSQQSPIKWNYAEFGVDQRIPPVAPSVLGFAAAHNGYFTTNASWRSRPGATYVGDAIASDTAVDGLFDYWVNSATQYVIKVSKSLFYKLVSSTWTSVSLGTVAVAAGNPVNFAVLNGVCVFGNGVGHTGSFDGTTITDLNAQLAPCKYFVTHGKRIFAAGNPTYPSRLFWCAADNPADWTTAGDAGFADCEKGDDIITGIGSYGGDIWVAKGEKNPGLMLFSGTSYDDFRFIPAFSHTGITGYHRTMLTVGNDLLFQGPNGIYSLNRLKTVGGNPEQARISDPVQRSFGQQSFAKIGTGCAVWVPDLNIAVFYLSKNGTALDNALCVSVPADISGKYRWASWDFTPTLSVAARYVTSTGRTVLLGGTSGRAAVWSGTLSTDQDGSEFPSSITMPFLSMGSQRQVKAARHFTQTYLAASTLTFNLTLLDGTVYTQSIPGSAGGTWNTGLWGSGFGSSASYPYNSGVVNTGNLPLRGLSTAMAPQIAKTSGVYELYDGQFDLVGCGRSEKA